MKRLNLGCGSKYKKGWVNLDFSDKDTYGTKIRADVYHDLNKFPWPFKDNEFDEILIEHTLEHLQDLSKIMKEMTRITKENGLIIIIVPHFSCYIAYRDPTHIHNFTLDSINYFKGNNKIVYKKLRASRNKVINLVSPLINLFPNVYERFFYGFFPVMECIWKLRVRKE